MQSEEALVIRPGKSAVIESTEQDLPPEAKKPMLQAFSRFKLFQPEFAALSCREAAEVVVDHAKARKSLAVSALAVHGLVESVRDSTLGEKIHRIGLIVPDGQPVIWALRLFHNFPLRSKVPGPDLCLAVLERAEECGLSIFIYGSTSTTLDRLVEFINTQYPRLVIAGMQADRFREASAEEDREDVATIQKSGAHIVLVGRGCPRQEHWVADHMDLLNCPLLAIGAAFDYHAGLLSRAPVWMQKTGLEWLHRLLQEPGRLWKRYLLTNIYFVWLVTRQWSAVLLGRGVARGS